jgi:hypothetical protein
LGLKRGWPREISPLTIKLGRPEEIWILQRHRPNPQKIISISVKAGLAMQTKTRQGVFKRIMVRRQVACLQMAQTHILIFVKLRLK